MTPHCSTLKLSRSCLSWQHPAGSLCREVLEHVHYWFSALRRLPFHSTSFRKCICELELRSPAYQSLNSTGMIQKAGPRLRNRGSWLPLAMGEFTQLRTHLFDHPCSCSHTLFHFKSLNTLSHQISSISLHLSCEIVTFEGAFWSNRFELDRTVTVLRLLSSNGLSCNIRACSFVCVAGCMPPHYQNLHCRIIDYCRGAFGSLKPIHHGYV